MKKKWIAAGAILCAAVLAAVYCLTPAPLLRDPQGAAIHRIELAVPSGDGVAAVYLTGQADLDGALILLSDCSRSRLPRSFAPFTMEEGMLELSLMDGGRTCHIVLGGNSGRDLFVVYESADRGGYTIHDGARVREALMALLPAAGP